MLLAAVLRLRCSSLRMRSHLARTIPATWAALPMAMDCARLTLHCALPAFTTVTSASLHIKDCRMQLMLSCCGLALQGIRPGEGAAREVAAYVLDHGHFAGVPPTAMVTCQPNMLPGSLGSSVHGAKVGSLQQFVPATTDCEEQGPSAFPVHEVHKIAQVCGLSQWLTWCNASSRHLPSACCFFLTARIQLCL